MFPGSAHVWMAPPPIIRRQPQRRSAAIDVAHVFSWEDTRHYVSPALLEAWKASPVGEDDHGAPLYRVHVTVRGGSERLYQDDFICGVSSKLDTQEMIIGRPSPLAASILKSEATYRVRGHGGLLAGF